MSYNIIFGLVVGVLIGVFLIVPGVRREASRDSAQKLVEANNNIATKNAAIKDYQDKISDLTKKLNALSDSTESSNTNMSFYKNLLAMYVSFNNGEYREAGEALSKINEDAIEPSYKDVYDKLKVQVNDKYCQMLYAEAGSNYNQGNYEEAIGTFEQIVQLNPTYGDGNALYFLAQSYRLTGDNQKAITYYQRLINECPDSAKVSNAKSHLERLTR
ncbi:MAG: tetratricopeptide repeat protein [Lachnospiraceae bacterium]|nr:tetratricopeptide repeat protein [Lachnospiraceae bacterium]